ncbi:MAG TPA: S41 family peptidase [Thermoanaerobaculia bacterium]|jgi:C-terminal processing protease CtpA/Prc|nr:S41 family peptidase [Thermoanaerobaculia bacterium]
MKLSAIRCLILAVFLLSLPAFAAEPVPAIQAVQPSLTLDRLVQVGRLWGTVRYLHPYLLYREIDWDAALVAALPRVEAAKSREEYGAAVQSLLDALGDPVTRVLPVKVAGAATPPAPPAAPAAPASLTRHLDDGTVVLDLGSGTQSMGNRDFMNGINAAFKDLFQAQAVIVDLRSGPDEDGGTGGELFSYGLAELSYTLVSRPCRAPSQRFVQRSGYEPQDGSSSGGYYESLVTVSAQSFAPDPNALGTKRIVFLVDRWTRLPAVALALQSVGDARIVIDGGALAEDEVVSARPVSLGEGLTAQVRVSEIVPMEGWPGLHADATGDFTAAVAELKKDGWGQVPHAAAVAPLPGPVFRPDKTYPEMLAPDLSHRRLAVIRAWNVIHFFYPYLHLLDDWDAVLPESLAAMEKAESARDYALAVLAMMAHVTDGHTSIYGHPEIVKYFGTARLPLTLRWVEEAAVVTAVGGDEAKAAGIAPGDAIMSVDGEPVPARIERLSRYVTASTKAALVNKICSRYLLLGPAGPAVLSVQSPGGDLREVRLTRDPKAVAPPPPAGDAVRILPGNLGYADLTSLKISEVDGMFERLKGTRGLILDMRGYPQGTAWSIAPYINTKAAKIGAQFRRPQVGVVSAEEGDAGFFFSQSLPLLRPGKELYTAPVVMIIDDRAISQSEHSGLFYEAANGTKFIGAATAGANGDVTGFTLPGGIHVGFTGHDVRHADGRQLQRIGLTPDIAAAPTRAGIRAGKDEVLERAMEYLEAR